MRRILSETEKILVVDLFKHLKDKRISTIARIIGVTDITISKTIDIYYDSVPKQTHIYLESKINYELYRAN
ncbi:hypothetical protein [Flavobacterium sp.]|uniref:hypothetical protein n=1 Tax=Flavobacterium sp. TaxID=239 RepID=UPI0026375495|nr:hypothetical protein [Flavobacterium sp.]